MVDQIVPGRARLGDAASGRDVIGRHAVAQGQQHAGTVDALRGRGFAGDVGQKRRLLDVGARRLPVVEFALRGRHGIPPLVRIPDVAVAILELRRQHARLDRLPHLLSRRPDVAEKHGLAIPARAERFMIHVDIGGTGQRVSHHQRRARQPIRLHERIDAALEITIAGEHGCGHEIAIRHGLGDGIGQRARIADAGGAAVADGLEAEGIEVLVEARSLEIVGDHSGSGREARLHPRLCGEPLRDRLPGHESRRHHHAGVAGVRATGDGCDHHGAMVDRGGMAVFLHGAGSRQVRSFEREAAFGSRRGERFGKRFLDIPKRDTVLRPLGPGETRHDAAQVEAEPLCKFRHRSGSRVEEPLLFHVPLHERHLLRRPAGEPQIGKRFGVDREEAHRGAILGGHVGDRGPVGQRHAVEAAPEKLHKLPDNTFFAKDFRDRQHEIGGSGTSR